MPGNLTYKLGNQVKTGEAKIKKYIRKYQYNMLKPSETQHKREKKAFIGFRS